MLEEVGESHGRVTNFVQSYPTSSQILLKKKASKMEREFQRKRQLIQKSFKKNKGVLFEICH